MISLKKGETEKGAWESARGTVSDAYCAAQALLALGKDEVFQNAFPSEKGFFPSPHPLPQDTRLRVGAGGGVKAGNGHGSRIPVWDLAFDWKPFRRPWLETWLESVLLVGF